MSFDSNPTSRAALSLWGFSSTLYRCSNTASLLSALDERIQAENEQTRRAAEEEKQYTVERDRLYQQIAQEVKLRPSDDPSGSGSAGKWPRQVARKTLGGRRPRSEMITTRTSAHDTWIASATPGREGTRQQEWADEEESVGSM